MNKLPSFHSMTTVFCGRIHCARTLSKSRIHVLVELTRIEQFTVDNRMWITWLRRIQRESNLDTVSKQQADDGCPWTSKLSIHHSNKGYNDTTTEKRGIQTKNLKYLWKAISFSNFNLNPKECQQTFNDDLFWRKSKVRIG